MRPSRVGLAITTAAFFLSGAAALVYQVAWQRVLALHTGVGIYSVALIVAAFMAGLGIGSQLGGEWSVRLSLRRALLAFGVLELAIAVFGTVSVPLYYDLLYTRGGALYSSPWLAVLLQFAALVPPTFLMGMSLPFLVRGTVEDAESAGRTIGVLYAVNMLGAAAGAMLAPWVLVRHLGLQGAVLVAAAANATAGLVVLALALRRRRQEGAVPAAPPQPSVVSEGRHPLSLWLFLYGGSGFCALSLEIIWFRLLDVATRSTAFTFGTLLATYLFGSALGALVGAALAPRFTRPLRAFLLCQCALIGYAGATVLLLVSLPTSLPGLSVFARYWQTGMIFHLGGTSDPARLLWLYVVLPAVVFGPPTFLMGLSFTALQRAVHDDPQTCGRKVGALQAANILGCVLGSLAVGLLGLEWLGTAGSLRAIVAASVAFAGVGAWVYGRRSVFPVLGAGLATLVFLLPGAGRLWPRLHGVEGTRSLFAEDATSVSAIVPFPDGWHVTVNGKHHSRLPFGGIHTRLGAMPAVLHPAPTDVAIIGLGSGDTAWAAGCRSETRSLTVFEIAGQQQPLLSRMVAVNPLPQLASFLQDPRLAVVVADGRHALARRPRRYDVIEADALWPFAAYAGNLYSVEFFRECAARLKANGLMCTWAPTGRVVASFRAAFPYVVAPGTRSFLIGSNEPIRMDVDAWRARAQDPALVRYLGSASAQEVARNVEKLRALDLSDGESREMNADLFPRDEFLTP